MGTPAHGEVEVGAQPRPGARCRFRVWAPAARRVQVALHGPPPREVDLAPQGRGYHAGVLEGVGPGDRYFLRVDGGTPRPDPASRHQPEGVHGPSAVVDPGAFAWGDPGWRGVPRRDLVFQEIHVGTFSPEGTFDGALALLPLLRDLGITALEVMPVAEFPGARNWGYDGVYPFAPHHRYGGPDGLRRLVDGCHHLGMAVFLDVVYNHLGPEGNYLGEFGPYFSERYRTPWGPAMNFDGAWCDEVRGFFAANAAHWIREYHMDGLRLDAIHGIFDQSAYPFLAEVAEAVHAAGREAGREVHVIAESDLNDPRVLRPVAAGGFGHDAQWSDDLHHALHTLLTAEARGYYEDFGEAQHLAAALQKGFVYTGQPSSHRRRRHGMPLEDRDPSRLVVFAQNHDQVGNRAAGDRLATLVSFEALKLAAGVILLSPYLPLLFMGEEYGETAPFPYFVSHGDPSLVEAVRRGRREEFAAFGWKVEVPDPQDENTFLSARLDRTAMEKPAGRALHRLHAELLRLRQSHPGLRRGRDGERTAGCTPDARVVWLRCGSEEDRALALFNFEDRPAAAPVPAAARPWRLRIDSADRRWLGPGGDVSREIPAPAGAEVVLAPQSFVLLE